MNDRTSPAGEMSGVEERKKLVAEAMAQADALEAQYKVLPPDDPPFGKWKAPVAFVVLLLAGVLAAFPPAWMAGPVPATIQEDDLERGLRAVLYLQATQVEVYRHRHGGLPGDLSQLPRHFQGLSYLRSTNRVYQITGRRPEGEVLVYDSGYPDPAFAAMAAGWSSEVAP